MDEESSFDERDEWNQSQLGKNNTQQKSQSNMVQQLSNKNFEQLNLPMRELGADFKSDQEIEHEHTIKNNLIISKMTDDELPEPLINTGASMSPDMKFGWKPKQEVSGAPIPLYYEYEPTPIPVDPLTGEEYRILYLGPRYKHSLEVHKAYSSSSTSQVFSKNKQRKGYRFQFPQNMGMIEQVIKATHQFVGMNPEIIALQNEQNELIFDSNFESGNLDMVIKKKDKEYDLYMRVDTNTRGHHQWFYFSVITNSAFKGLKVKFNIVNFTKNQSLYNQGMRICISQQSKDFVWDRCGEQIKYGTSKLIRRNNTDKSKIKYYYQLSFQYEFTEETDLVYFSYAFPYTYSMLQTFLGEINHTHRQQNKDFMQESVLCKSLGGVDVPLITITSRLLSDPEEFHIVKLEEFQDSYSRVSLPFYRKKKHIIVDARVHPGESNASYMMQGFLRYIVGDSYQAQELRKRCIFKIVPMINPDGVIIGNYRTSLLHPTVCAMKQLVASILAQKDTEEDCDEDIVAFIDMHGHSRKKNVFIYGPYYPLHSDKYFKMRVIPKLISEETSKFRFFSCKFRIEKSKEKAARLVLWETEEFTQESYEQMSEPLVNSLQEYLFILEEDDRQKKIKELQKRKKKKRNDRTGSSKAQPFENDSKNKKDTLLKAQNKKGSQKMIFEESKQEDQILCQNPNEPPSLEITNIAYVASQRIASVQRTSIDLSAKLNSNGAARSLTQIYKQLKVEEKKYQASMENGEVNEEDDDDNDDDKSSGGEEDGSSAKGNNNSGSDSDPQDDELSGEEKDDLKDNIISAIDQFAHIYNPIQFGNQSKKPVSLKKKKTFKDQPSSNSPAPAFAIRQATQSALLKKATIVTSQQQTSSQKEVQQQQIKTINKKRQQMSEDSKAWGREDQYYQKNRLATQLVNNTTLNKSVIPSYQKQMTTSQGYYIIKPNNGQPKSFTNGGNPLIINKIVTDVVSIMDYQTYFNNSMSNPRSGSSNITNKIPHLPQPAALDLQKFGPQDCNYEHSTYKNGDPAMRYQYQRKDEQYSITNANNSNNALAYNVSSFKKRPQKGEQQQSNSTSMNQYMYESSYSKLENDQIFQSEEELSNHQNKNEKKTASTNHTSNKVALAQSQQKDIRYQQQQYQQLVQHIRPYRSKDHSGNQLHFTNLSGNDIQVQGFDNRSSFQQQDEITFSTQTQQKSPNISIPDPNITQLSNYHLSSDLSNYGALNNSESANQQNIAKTYQFPANRSSNIFRLQKQKYYNALKKRALVSPKGNHQYNEMTANSGKAQINSSVKKQRESFATIEGQLAAEVAAKGIKDQQRFHQQSVPRSHSKYKKLSQGNIPSSKNQIIEQHENSQSYQGVQAGNNSQHSSSNNNNKSSSSALNQTMQLTTNHYHQHNHNRNRSEAQSKRLNSMEMKDSTSNNLMIGALAFKSPLGVMDQSSPLQGGGTTFFNSEGKEGDSFSLPPQHQNKNLQLEQIRQSNLVLNKVADNRNLVHQIKF